MAINGKKQEYWSRQFERWQESGLTRRAYCAREGLALSTFDHSCLALEYSFLCSVLILSGVVSNMAIPRSSALRLHEQSRVPSLGRGCVVLRLQAVL